MLPHERDKWDIASSVVVTALRVAAGRATESKRAPANAWPNRIDEPLLSRAVI